DAALAAVGLDPERFAHRAVHELSGGEQRRVVLAGLLTAQPRLLVLDEPLAGLDRAGRDAVLRALHALRSAGITLVVVTHDAAALDDLADATLTVDGGKVEGPYARAAPGPAAPTSAPRRRNRVRRRGALVGAAGPGAARAYGPSTFPPSTVRVASARSSRAAASWVTTTRVIPALRNACRARSTASRPARSSPASGSSSTRRRGWAVRSPARTTRRCSPPLSSWTARWANRSGSRPTAARAA